MLRLAVATLLPLAPLMFTMISLEELFKRLLKASAEHSSVPLASVFPVLQTLKESPEDKVELVGETIIEEVLQDIGILDFGGGTSAKANVALWRKRGDHRPLIGEFAFDGLLFLVVGGSNEWKLPLALAVTVLVSSYVIHSQTMWRQAPIAAAHSLGRLVLIYNLYLNLYR